MTSAGTQAAWRAGRVAVVAVWLVLAAVLVQRAWVAAYGPARAGAGGAGQVAAAGEEWHGVYQGGRKIGYSHQVVDAEGDGRRFSQTSVLRVALLGTPQTVHTVARGETDASGAVRTLSFQLRSGGTRFGVRARVEERSLEVVVETGGETVVNRTLAVDGPIYLPTLARALVAARPLAPGREVAVPVFDPLTLQSEQLRLVVEREEMLGEGAAAQRVWRLREEYRGLASTVWMDADGRVVREEGPMGLVLVREDPAVAVAAGWGSDDLPDLVAAVAIPVGEIAEPRTRPTLRVRLDGVEPERVPTDGVQRWEGGALVIAPPSDDLIGTYPLPYRGADLGAELAADPWVQADHPEIRAAAAKAVGGERDAKEAARLLTGWVFRSLRKVPTASVPTALEVLRTGQGDCNEHAVLLAALARAAGIPARVVAGVVYADSAFQYHAWCEVWLGWWVPVDPAFGQFPADATHLKLVTGGLERQVALLDVIGRLRITPVDAPQ